MKNGFTIDDHWELSRLAEAHSAVEDVIQICGDHLTKKMLTKLMAARSSLDQVWEELSDDEKDVANGCYSDDLLEDEDVED